MIPVPKLSKLAGVDKGVFRGKEPSKEIEDERKRDYREFKKHKDSHELPDLLGSALRPRS